MGFLMMATVIWLLYVLDGQVGSLVFLWVAGAAGCQFWRLGVGALGTLMRSKTTCLLPKPSLLC
ncbi:MAG: hypothetical protein R3C26_09545 [Calditrichia bacterium]